jgi:hypothetical protein
MCQERAGDLDFPFQSIADAMRFIDDRELPVIVPFEEGGAVAPLIWDLQAGPERGNGSPAGWVATPSASPRPSAPG